MVTVVWWPGDVASPSNIHVRAKDTAQLVAHHDEDRTLVPHDVLVPGTATRCGARNAPALVQRWQPPTLAFTHIEQTVNLITQAIRTAGVAQKPREEEAEERHRRTASESTDHRGIRQQRVGGRRRSLTPD